MRLLFLCGSRGEWGYIRPLVRLCHERDIDYGICATNMVLLPRYGDLVAEIEADGYVVSDRILMSLEGSTHFSMAKSLGIFLSSFVDVVVRTRPDWLVLAGDRGEQLMGATAAAYTYTPAAHIQAGERSGNIDGVARHAIAKLVHLHFTANDDAAQRLVRMGEEPFRIHTVGAPQLDELRRGEYTPLDELAARYSLALSGRYMLVVVHPVTEEYEQLDAGVHALLTAVSKFDWPKVCILPNNDAGADRIRDALLSGRPSNMQIFRNLPRRDFLGLLNSAVCIVGNSSAGLIEAPTFGIPAINVGRRQQDRVQGSNVLNVKADASEIEEAISTAMTTGFRRRSAGPNPYGDGRSSERILAILEQTPRDDRLLVKTQPY